jgi:CheY-like chemotaxis protein
MNDKKKDHILLVDDEQHLLISLRDYLTFENFIVTTAQSGEEALELVEKVNPDLIILDVSMPGMGGLGFLKRISATNNKPRFPVLVLTARSMMADFFRDVEVDGFIAKPCEETELTSIVRAILAKRKRVAELRQRVKRKVLIAEDDPAIAVDLVRLLGGAGYDVEVVSSGPELLEKATQIRPDLVLTKEVLPRLNGSAVASLMEVMPSISTVPVLIYDGGRSKEEMGRLKSGQTKCVREYLATSKPSLLVMAVNSVLAAG